MLPIRLSIPICALLLVLPAVVEAAEPRADTKAKVLPIRGERIISDRPVLFKSRSAELSPESHSVLASVAATLETHLTIQLVEIGVHTDSQGSSAYNKRMSQERADAVRQGLIEIGVEAVRLTAVGYGEDRPIDSNSTAAGRERNRRVEFVIKTRQKGRVP